MSPGSLRHRKFVLPKQRSLLMYSFIFTHSINGGKILETLIVPKHNFPDSSECSLIAKTVKRVWGWTETSQLIQINKTPQKNSSETGGLKADLIILCV